MSKHWHLMDIDYELSHEIVLKTRKLEVMGWVSTGVFYLVDVHIKFRLLPCWDAVAADEQRVEAPVTPSS